ncbi:MAG: hypothetical protein MZU95_11785 [Desulfomicrobium escambiense]|nr:hypothetical protein [Desulfomicrobium escambiense]
MNETLSILDQADLEAAAKGAVRGEQDRVLRQRGFCGGGQGRPATSS